MLTIKFFFPNDPPGGTHEGEGTRGCREEEEGQKDSCDRDGAATGGTDKQDARKNKLFPSLQFPIGQSQFICPGLILAPSCALPRGVSAQGCSQNPTEGAQGPHTRAGQ